ncbi:hypothetical protein CRE_18771 [Caenorhabditis remanei]|uniref:Glycosyltransferase family 92 protein n=1 Tax=Caenorhabditis remanei TaxID=31234 RepID=E3LK46_CAERE|nr:hypothetical protein CRE_18771 [Caenorhabditis remanei]
MELKTIKLIFFTVITTIYLLSFFIVPPVIENGDQYLIMFSSFKKKLAEAFFGDPITNTDAYIVSTYYYPKSKSLGENALAMVLLMNRNTMRDITKYKMHLVATNGSGYSVELAPKILKEAYANCAYNNIIVHSTVLLNMNKLEIVDGNTRMEVSFDFHTLSLSDLLQIPFRQPRVTAPAPVILCISPQFVAEQWQIFVTHAHIAHYFGGHLHLYVTSMLESYFNLVKEYEKLGYVTVDYWMRYKFKNKTFDSPEPNSNVEWRNQAGAHTDCLLHYDNL